MCYVMHCIALLSDLVAMEENVFASFALSRPPIGTAYRGRHSRQVAHRGAQKSAGLKQENAQDCSSRSKLEMVTDDSRGGTGMLGAQAANGWLSAVKTEADDGELLNRNYVKEEEKDMMEATSVPSSHDNQRLLGAAMSPPAMKRGSGKLRDESIPEIEECGVLSCSTTDSSNLGKRAKIARSSKKASSAVQIAPDDWEQVLDKIRIMRTDRDAPVDLLGPGQLVDRAASSEAQNFHVLVAAMISSQTRDAATAAGMKRLHAIPGGLTVQNIAAPEVRLETLEGLLKPVGFYRQKAKYLKGIAEILIRPPYCGSVPRELDELMKLPGVGPKVGLLVLWVSFGMGEEGLIVDTNVRRVCCRLGWAPEDSTAVQVREALESWLPRRLWADLSFMFVGFGQQICKSIGPRCGECLVHSCCPSAFQCGKKLPIIN